MWISSATCLMALKRMPVTQCSTAGAGRRDAPSIGQAFKTGSLPLNLGNTLPAMPQHGCLQCCHTGTCRLPALIPLFSANRTLGDSFFSTSDWLNWKVCIVYRLTMMEYRRKPLRLEEWSHAQVWSANEMLLSGACKTKMPVANSFRQRHAEETRSASVLVPLSSHNFSFFLF